MSHKANVKKVKGAETAVLVPRLRFPEFRGAGEWELKDLEKICDINPPNTGLPDTFDYIDLESVEAGELKTKKKISRDNAPSRAQRVLQNGDVIYQSVRPYQKNNWFCVFNDDDNYVASTGYAQLRAYDSKEFLYQIVHCDDFVGRVIAQCTGSNYPAINSSDLAKIHVAIPRHKEQQKIADCLSSLDEAITLEAKRLEALKVHKQGLMQQLFPAEEETVPRLRFPEFRGAGEWLHKNLEDIAQFFKGRGISKSDTDARGEIPCIRYGELYTTYGEVIDAVVSKTTLPLASLFLSHKYDVLIPSSGETRIDIARAACVLISGVGLGGDLNVLRSKENGVFLSYFLNGAYKKTIAKIAQGDTIVHLYPSHITSLLIPIPDGREQQKIADCLSSLDEVITLESQELEALKVHKKGLMQQLFPRPDEIGT